MKGFEFSEYIDASPAVVFDLLSDPTRATAFLDNITKSEKLTDGPIGIGTVFRETRRIGGKEASADLRIDAFEPPNRVAVSSEAEGIAVSYYYVLAPEGGGTRLTWTSDLEAGGLRRMMLPVVAGIMKKEDGAHLAKLKAYLESMTEPDR